MDTVEVTEKQRQQLEQSIFKLRKALKHWQVHSAEYEGLKEELLALPKRASREQMLAIADDFGGDVITRQEITSFLGDKEGIKRSHLEVAAAVKHRIDYIQENVEKIEKQLELGESALDNVRVIENSGQLTNEEGLPVMDIKEDLDEKGDIIKSDVSSGGVGSAKPFNVDAAIKSFQPIVETLAQKEKEKATAKPVANATQDASSGAKAASAAPLQKSVSKAPSKDQIQQKKPVPSPKPQPRTPKRIQATEKEYSPQSGMVLTEKRVKPKLVPDVKEVAPETKSKDEGLSIQEIVSKPEELKPAGTANGSSPNQPLKEGVARIRVIDDEEDDSDASEDEFENLLDVEESEEDAKLREEMLKYNMREMNNIVAEIELEEQDMSDDYDDDEEDEEYGTDDEDDEDKWGRSQGQLVSNKIRREMMLLQKKIEAREKAQQVAAEVGSSPATIDTSNHSTTKEPVSDDHIYKDSPKKEKKKSTEKKGVRFAEELDISPAPPPISKPPSNPSELVGDEFDEEIDPSILDMVFGPGTKDQEEKYFQNTTDQPKKKLPSLFKAARQVQKAKEQVSIERPSSAGSAKDQTAPIMAGDIVERKPTKSTPMAPKPPGNPKMKKTTTKSSTEKQEPTVVALDPLGEELSDEDRPIMASSIIERAPSWDASAKSPSSTLSQREPRAPDELDPEFHQREVTNAYFAMRNKLIQRQGGFVETEEDKMTVPIDENMEKKKISRFKAGKVKNQLP